jgi:hypothetical protein
MENSAEFQNVVINRGERLDPDAMQAGVLTAVDDLFRSGESIGAVVLECTNLITLRRISANPLATEMISKWRCKSSEWDALL